MIKHIYFLLGHVHTVYNIYHICYIGDCSLFYFSCSPNAECSPLFLFFFWAQLVNKPNQGQLVSFFRQRCILIFFVHLLPGSGNETELQWLSEAGSSWWLWASEGWNREVAETRWSRPDSGKARAELIELGWNESGAGQASTTQNESPLGWGRRKFVWRKGATGLSSPFPPSICPQFETMWVIWFWDNWGWIQFFDLGLTTSPD